MKTKQRVLSTLLSVVMAFGVVPSNALAAGNVVKNGSETTFAKNIPSATAYVASIGQSAWEKAEFAPSNDKITRSAESFGQSAMPRECYIRYIPDTPMTAGTYDIGGYTMLYKDVVMLSDGTNADLESNVSDIKIVLTGTGSTGAINLLNGKWDGLFADHFKDDGDFKGRTSFSDTTNVRVLKNGKPVDCTLLFSMTGIDAYGIKQEQLGQAESPAVGRGDGYEYEEFAEPRSGMLSDVYLPDNSVLRISDKVLIATEEIRIVIKPVLPF